MKNSMKTSILNHKTIAIILSAFMIAGCFTLAIAPDLPADHGMNTSAYVPAYHSATVNRARVASGIPAPLSGGQPLMGVDLGNISIGDYSYVGVYDPSNTLVYIADGMYHSVSVLNSSTDKTVKAINVVGNAPEGITYYQSGNQIYTANAEWNDLSVIDGNSSDMTSLLDHTPTFYSPFAVAYSTSSNLLYVCNGYGNNISVVQPITGYLNQWLPVHGFDTSLKAVEPIIYDPATQYILVVNGTNLTAIQGTTIMKSFGIGGSPGGIAIDPVDHLIFVSVGSLNEIQVYSEYYPFKSLGAISTAKDPAGLAFAPTNDKLYILYGNSPEGNVSVANVSNYTVFDTFQTHSSSTVSALYDPSNGNVYIFSDQTTNATVIATDLHTITYTETGLPLGSNWSVTFDGVTHSSVTNSITFSATNGIYESSYGNVTDYRGPSSGYVTVNDSTTSFSVNYVPVTYDVSFTESGLPSGTLWYVNLSGGISGNSIQRTAFFDLQNSSYAYSVSTADKRYQSHGGSLNVSGNTEYVFISFSPVTYDVTFTESGLAAGASWFVTVGGVTQFSSSGTMTFLLVNGTYAYTVPSLTGYNSSVTGGVIIVNGPGTSQSLTFSPQKSTGSTGAGNSTRSQQGFLASLNWGDILIGLAADGALVSIVFLALRKRGSKGGT